MANPWLKKNPFMSAWLSGAHRVAGSVRGRVAAQARRQLGAAVAQAGNESIKQWFGTSVAAAPRAKPKRRR